jgi:hypothetical protein
MRVSLRRFVLFVFGFATLPLFAQQTINIPADYPTIQQGIDHANDGDTVKVTGTGIYKENVNLGSKAISLVADTTGGPTIDGNATGPAITISGTAADQATVQGFRIINAGKASSAASPHGAIYISGATASVISNIFSNNFCASIYSTSADPIISHNNITGTLSTGCPSEQGLGSAIAIHGFSATPRPALPYPSISYNTIANNVSSVEFTDQGGGGGLSVTGAHGVLVEDNVFSGNVSTGYGGAFYIATTPTLLFLGNLVYDNKGISGGLDIVVSGNSALPPTSYIIDNTIANNTATSSNAGADIYLAGNLSGYTMANNIVVGNSSTASINCGSTSPSATPLVSTNNDFFSFVSTSKIIASNCPAALTGPFTNSEINPQFQGGTTSAGAGGPYDFQLLSNSPAIDAGIDSVYSLLTYYGFTPPTDLATNSRYVSVKGPYTIDLGAFEYQDTTPITNLFASIALVPSTYTPSTGSPLTLTASVTLNTGATPNGVVSFYQDGILIGSNTPDTTGQAPSTILSFPSGTHYFYANYTPSGGSLAQSIPFYLIGTAATIAATQTQLTSAHNPSTFGDNVPFTATVTATGGAIPTGTVYFYDGSMLLGNAPVTSSGTAPFATSALTVGPHTMTATFVGSGNFGTSSGSYLETVNAVPLTASKASLNITPSSIAYGATTTLTATVTAATGPNTPIPSGSVTFFDGSTQIGATPLNGAGIASLPINTLPVGTHTITCLYGGNTVYATSACTGVTLTVNQANAALTLVSSENPSPALMAVTFTATLTNTSLPGNPPVAGVPLHFAVDGVAQTTTPIIDINGNATLTLMPSAGRHQIAVTNGVTTNYTTATMALTETEQPNPTSLTLIVSPNPAYFGQTVNAIVTVSALTGTASAGGTITVFDAGKSIATGTVTSGLCSQTGICSGGLATLTLPLKNLAVGDHPLTATFTPDINFLASSTSAPTVLTIKPSGFTLTANPTALNVQTQHHTALTLTLASIGNFSGEVGLACTATLPPVLKCEFAQSNLPLAVNGTASTKLTLETDAINNFYPASLGRNALLTLLTLLPLSLLALRKRRGFAALAILALATLALTTGCTGRYPDHTPPGTYDIAITATGGSAQPQTAHVILTVTP